MTAAVTIMPPGADIFASGCEALVNPVNCVGVSGNGLALEFKRRFPQAVRWYEDTCRRGVPMRPGEILVDSTRVSGGMSLRMIIFATTKDHWRQPSQLVWVESCLAQIAT